MPQLVGSGVDTYIAHFPFYKTNVGDANGTLNGVEPTTLEYVMPFGGSIIGFTCEESAALTTGTLVFQPTINGSLCPALPDAASVRTNQQYGYYTQDAHKANYDFTAGQRLGVMYAKSDTINATTTDLNALLVVLLERVQY
jgi:hypothetical protein